MIFEITNTDTASHRMTAILHDAFPFFLKNKYPAYKETPKYNETPKYKDPLLKPNRTLPKLNGPANMKTTTQTSICRGASFVVGQKLRESKWFQHDELRVLCAVVESGFIVERENGDENLFGVALWKPGFEKSKNADYIQIYTLSENKGRSKVVALKLLDFWPIGTRLRINNKSDKDNVPHKEDIIRNQVEYAVHFKQKWHNSQHFTYWCRYEDPQVHCRIKQISDSVKWANVGISTGLLLLKKRKRSKSETQIQ